jgi:hypothetical protein
MERKNVKNANWNNSSTLERAKPFGLVPYIYHAEITAITLEPRAIACVLLKLSVL